jgi:branched-chain amino acid transport system ATP-binding protein
MVLIDNTEALAVNQVSVQFGGIQALDSVDLEVARGEIHGLIGPNGAGKTTLFDVITGLQRPTRGRVRLGGHDVTAEKPYRRARRGLSRTFQRLELFGTLTARENVQIAAELRRSKVLDSRTPAQEVEHLLERLGILDVADEPTDSLPTGLARLVEMARALATDPSLLLLDEPSSGLDAGETHGLGVVLRELAAEGMAILLVEHDMTLVMGVCARVDVLDYGRVIARGDPAAVRADPLVQEAYLGSAALDSETEPFAKSRSILEPPTLPKSGAERPKVPLTTLPSRAPSGLDDEFESNLASRDPLALQATDVRVAYGRIEVLHGVSLEVPRGTALALLGPNGAGKTTLLKAMSGQLELAGGSVEVGGRRLAKNAIERLARTGLCMIPESRSVFPNLTVSENLLMYTFGRQDLKPSMVEEQAFARFPVLGTRPKQLAGTLSGGEQRMLAMARALTISPSILLLDELSMGLAPLIVEELYGIVGQLVASEHLTIVMVEQFVQTALSIADHAVIMVHGELVESGSPEDIRREAVGAYLGTDSE